MLQLAEFDHFKTFGIPVKSEIGFTTYPHAIERRGSVREVVVKPPNYEIKIFIPKHDVSQNTC